MKNQDITPEIGTKLTLEVKSKNSVRKFTSQLLDVSEKTYTIGGPIVKNSFVPLHVSTKVKVIYYKKNHGRVTFDAIIIDRKVNNIYKLIIERISILNKIQERNYYRLPIQLNSLKNHKDGNKNISDSIIENCRIEDISGSGVKILCNFKHKIGDIIDYNISINGEIILLKGIIVRINESNNSEYQYSVGVQTIDLSEINRDKIIKFIFTQQRKLRKKGLI